MYRANTTLSGHIFATKARIDNRKKLLSSNISSTSSHNMVNFGPLVAEIDPVVWGTPSNFNGFLLRLGSIRPYCMALQYWVSAKLCGVEQRAPHIFGRAAVTLGIGPHSSYKEQFVNNNPTALPEVKETWHGRMNHGYVRPYRASVKLFELGVRTPRVCFWAYGTPGVSILGVFIRQAFPFSA